MAAVFKLKALIPTESDECANLLQWAAVTKHQGRRLSELLIMIPNGAVLAGDAKHRAMQMNRMKKLGFRPGVSDYFLPVPVGVHHGLWLEMKRTSRGILSDAQLEFHAAMRTQGYATAVSVGFEQAINAIKRYLKT